MGNKRKIGTTTVAFMQSQIFNVAYGNSRIRGACGRSDVELNFGARGWRITVWRTIHPHAITSVGTWYGNVAEDATDVEPTYVNRCVTNSCAESYSSFRPLTFIIISGRSVESPSAHPPPGATAAHRFQFIEQRPIVHMCHVTVGENGVCVERTWLTSVPVQSNILCTKY